MINTKTSFYGQQENEKILYVTKPHPIARIVGLIKIYLITVITFIILFYLAGAIPEDVNVFRMLGIIVPITILIIGTKVINNFQKRNISYITDRRIVRFDPTNFFATNVRTLSWDEAVKVKTFSPNILWKQLKIGTVIVHARTTVKTVDEELNNTVTADDIELDNIYLYRDLGNYIDKILFTYKQMPKEVSEIHPFIPKPKGQRY